MINILAVLKSKNTKSSYIRIIQIFENLDKTQFSIVFVNQKHVKFSHILSCTIVVVQRAEDINLNIVLKFAKFLKKKIIYEIDDFLLDIPKISRLGKRSANVSKNVFNYLNLADLIVCSTHKLKEQLALVCDKRKIHVIENVIDFERFDSVENPTKSEEYKIVVSNTDYFKLLNRDYFIDDLKLLISEFNDRLKVFFIGIEIEEFRNYHNIVHINTLNYSDYIKFIVYMNFTVALVPLEESKFHACKSIIKYLDFSLARIPVVCSNVSPYKEIIIDKYNGLLVDNATKGAWYSAIKYLITNPDLRTGIVERARFSIKRDYSITSSVKKWEKLLSDMVK